MKDSNLKIAVKDDIQKSYEVLLATLDYHLEQGTFRPPGEATFVTDDMLKTTKLEVVDFLKKGKLSKIKSLLNDFTETPRVTIDLDFIIYIKEKTGHDIDIFNSYFKRIDKIIQRGKINTDNQLFEVSQLIYYLYQLTPIDKERIEILKKLVDSYNNN